MRSNLVDYYEVWRKAFPDNGTVGDWLADETPNETLVLMGIIGALSR